MSRLSLPSFTSWVLLLSCLIVALLISPINSAIIPSEAISKEDEEAITDLLHLTIHESRNGNDHTVESSTPLGTIVIALFGKIVPNTVENFKGLSETYSKTETLFHRVIPGFVIQAGDFDNNGGRSFFGYRGASPPADTDHPEAFGPFYSGLEDENFQISHNKVGRVSVANAGPNTGGSQFFICLEPVPFLDGKHVVFGQVIEGMDIAQKIANVERDSNDKPKNDVFIYSTKVEPYKSAQKDEKTAEEGKVGIIDKADTPSDTDSGYAKEHPTGLGGSKRHLVLIPFAAFVILACYLGIKNRRSINSLIRGPRYRRVAANSSE